MVSHTPMTCFLGMPVMFFFDCYAAIHTVVKKRPK